MWQIWLVTCIAFSLTIGSLIFPYKPNNIRRQEQQAEHVWLVYIIRFIHYGTFTFTLLYPFIFPSKYDGYYLGVLVLLWIHWQLLQNECILSLWEKQLLNATYKTGDDPYSHPLLNVYINKEGARIVVYLTLFAYAFVFVRFLRTHRDNIIKASTTKMNQK